MPNDPTSELGNPGTGTIGPRGPVGAASRSGATFFGHPRGLATLFYTEMWERFSYYGMRALLILFMTAPLSAGGLQFDTQKAGAIYGLYTGGVYLMALPGGWLADRFLGLRRAVFIGGVLIASGHFSMAIPSIATFYLGLGLIVLGTGLLKPNVSAMVGELYHEESGARRDAGFSIFYMGINLGAFIAPLVCGYLGQNIDWHLGFAAAGVGMVIGLIQYVLGKRHLGDAGLYPDASIDRDREKSRLFKIATAAAVVIGAVALLQMTGMLGLSAVTLANIAGAFIVSVAAVYFAYILIAGGLTPLERNRVLVIGVFFLAAAMFWAGFEQAGSSLNLFAERNTDLNVFGWNMPASWLQSVNALMIIALAPVFAWVWVTLSSRKSEPSSPAKFSFGLIFMGLGFMVMVAASTAAASGVRVSPLWLVLTYLLHTIGELTLSPVGLSTVTKLAPHRLVGQMMGIWFLATSLGNLIAGRVAGFFEALPLPQLFGYVAMAGIGFGIVLALFVRPLKKMSGGVN
jgi:POT family proton-dependent oligopeptide transporter